MSRIHILLVIALAFFYVAGNAQAVKTDRVTWTFDRDPIAIFVNVLQQQTSYTFYYDPALFDSFAVSMTAHDLPLEEVLKNAFHFTNYYASIDADKHVFLTKNAIIVTTLQAPGENAVIDSFNSVPFNIAAANLRDRTFENDKLFQIGIKSPASVSPAVLKVLVLTTRTQQPVASSSVTIDNKTVLNGDSTGIYKLKLTQGRHLLTINSFGKKKATRHLLVYGNGTLPVLLEDEIKVLEDVTVTTQKNNNVNRTQLGFERLNIKSIKQVPAIFGEADVLRVILTLPGVSSVGEASTGFNVRGGGTDQNLIQFNDATIFNPSHFFGFFSAFNPEIVKDVELYKSSIPAKYGGPAFFGLKDHRARWKQRKIYRVCRYRIAYQPH